MKATAKITEMEKISQASMTDLNVQGTQEISTSINQLLANVFALYIKTKNFHWHISGAHFHAYHLLLDEQASDILAIADLAAERVRKMNQLTIHSIGEISQLQTILDNDMANLHASEMLLILMEDNKMLARELRELHLITDQYQDYATSNLLDDWIDGAEQRAWFLFESSRA